MRVGIGYDTHALSEGKNLIIGGVVIPYELGFVAHSDGDVLTHAIMDSLLGAAGLRDIGYFFPDTSLRYKGIESFKLLQMVMEKIRENFKVVNVDSVILCQKPKLSSYIDDMQDLLSNVIDAPVGVKATTTEKMNAEGQGLCISAQAVSLLEGKKS